MVYNHGIFPMGNQPTYSLPIRKDFFTCQRLSLYSLFPTIILIIREEIVPLIIPIPILNVVLIPIRDEFIRLNLRVEMVEVVEIVAHGGIVSVSCSVGKFRKTKKAQRVLNRDKGDERAFQDEPFKILWVITVDEWSVSSCHDGIVPKWFVVVNDFTAIPQAFPVFHG